MAKNLSGTKTHQNLKDAFAGESQANRRYLYFAKTADVEGHPDLAGLFRDTAEGETGHAHGHLDWLKQVGDPATGQPIGDTSRNLKAAIAGETYEYTEMYPGFAKTARDGFMRELCGRYPGYGFSAHKGYGTPEHLDALRRLGPSPVHRRSFAPVQSSALVD